jgi:hypothetical protein
MACGAAGYVQTGVDRCAAMANFAPRPPVELCLFLLAFCSELALRKHERGSRKLKSAAPSHDRMMLLNFTAGLTAQFRFVSTVTNLQQTIRGRRAARSIPARATKRKIKGNRTAAVC